MVEGQLLLTHTTCRTRCHCGDSLFCLTQQADDPEYTRRKVKDFLLTHTAYELIPESGKVVLLDSALPIRQAFHALHEQVGTFEREIKSEYVPAMLLIRMSFRRDAAAGLRAAHPAGLPRAARAGKICWDCCDSSC